jgi:hypothetical protein
MFEETDSVFNNESVFSNISYKSFKTLIVSTRLTRALPVRVSFHCM